MSKKLLLVVSLLLAFGLVALAADISGTWKAQVPGRQGNLQERTFMFKVEGDKLTGSMSGRQGETPLAEGKVTGDTVTFKITRERGGNTITEVYTGTVAGSEIKFKMQRQGGEGMPVEFTARKGS
jgi:hypothetical protein